MILQVTIICFIRSILTASPTFPSKKRIRYDRTWIHMDAKRFLERINDEKKNWKFSSADIAERGHWDAYMKAYEDAMEATSTADSPWYIIPVDRKWFARLAVGKIIVDTLEKISPQFPELPEEEQARLASYRQILEDER